MKRALAGTAMADGVLVVCGIITGSFVARMLEPAGRGAVAAALLWPQVLAGIGLVSLNEAVTYRIGADRHRADRVIAAALWVALALSLVTILVAYLAMPWLLGESRRELLAVARGYLVYVPFSFLALVQLGADQGRLQFARFNLLRASVPVLYLAALIGLWMADAVSVAAVVAINCAATVGGSLIRLAFRLEALRVRPAWADVVALLSIGIRFHGVTLITLLSGQIDRIMVLALWDDATLGIYVVALTVASSGLSTVSNALQKVLFPHVVHAPNREAGIALFARSVRHAMLLLAIASAMLMVVLPLLLPLLFGEKFGAARDPAWGLLAAFVLVGVKNVAIQGLRGLGEGGAGFVAVSIDLLVFTTIAWLYGAAAGPVGLAAAMVIANAMALTYLFTYVSRRYDTALRDFWGLNPDTMAELYRAVSRLGAFITHRVTKAAATEAQAIRSSPSVGVVMLGARQHYALAGGLALRGLLDKLYTDLYAGNKPWMGWLVATVLAKARPAAVDRYLGRRQDAIPPRKVMSFDAFGLVYAWRVRRARTAAARENIYLGAARAFNARVIARGLAGADVVIGISGATLEILRHAKDRGILGIVEQVIAPARWTRRLLERELERWPGWEESAIPAQDPRLVCREEEEWRLADRVLAPSRFVIDALIAEGVPPGKCRFTPWWRPDSCGKEKWRILPVGEVNNQPAACQGGHRRNAPWARVSGSRPERMRSREFRWAS